MTAPAGGPLDTEVVMGEAPINLDRLQADDGLLDRIGRGEQVPADDLERLLVEWREKIRDIPAPRGAQDTVDRVMRRYRRRRRWVRLRDWLTRWWER